MNVIETVDLTKRFGNFTANDKINLTVEKNEIKCICGENGAGKSTLMNMLYGALQPTSGKILINGKEVHFKSPVDAIACGIGMVHQHSKLVPSLTVYENIMLGIEISKKAGKFNSPFIDEKEERRQVQELIEKYHFQLNAEDKVADLSVGQCQQLEILKMLYRNVDILILDEPTSVLTPQEVDWLIDNLKNLSRQGKTILVITHKLREVMAVSDSVTVIRQGKVIGVARTKDTNERELAQMMVGRDVVLTVSNENGGEPGSDTVYEVSGLCTNNHLGLDVLKNVSFQIHNREIYGIAGVEGNGQSELIKVLTGIMLATKGSVRLFGEDITNLWPDELRRKKIGIIPEDRYKHGLCRDMTLADNCSAGYLDDAEITRRGILNRKNMQKRCHDYIEKYDIRIADEYGNVSQCSGGNAQKLIIAREFESSPRLIIACQPTRGVDVGSIEYIHQCLLDFRNKGYSVLLISSELSEIMSLSDRVGVMYKGEIIGEADPKTASVADIGLLMAGTIPEGMR
ncbi:MAG: ABC transporter ATP-binding protein [Oscillospiraceae bacterium]|nr:ABC transporter ATP-binding protein [Oscillospiraceae bacterium]